MSIKKMLVGTTTALLLASYFITTVFASEIALKNNLPKENDKGIELPSDMEISDVYEEAVDVTGDEDLKHIVTKTDEELHRNPISSVSIMADQIKSRSTIAHTIYYIVSFMLIVVIVIPLIISAGF